MIEIALATLLAAILRSEELTAAQSSIGSAWRVRARTLVHVRIQNPGDPIEPSVHFTPRVPAFLAKASEHKISLAREDAVVPRVCLATTISGALTSISLGIATLDAHGCGTPKRIDIYTNAHPVDIGVPSEKGVHDASGTGEVWAVEPLLLHHVESFNEELTEALAAAYDRSDERLIYVRKDGKRLTEEERAKFKAQAIAMVMRKYGVADTIP